MPRPARHDVPFVPGAFLLHGVLNTSECTQILSSSTAMGYAPDSPLNAPARSINAHTFVWVVDEAMARVVFERCRGLLPPAIDGGALAGLNARWRCYRYVPGAHYRPHVDGAWPGSGFRDGKLVYDVYGDRWSRLTFLIYLNDDFDGGATTFYTPSPKVGVLDSRGVRPKTGSVLVFPHGDTNGSLVHEGSPVTRGAKYVVRTEVLYKTTPLA